MLAGMWNIQGNRRWQRPKPQKLFDLRLICLSWELLCSVGLGQLLHNGLTVWPAGFRCGTDKRDDAPAVIVDFENVNLCSVAAGNQSAGVFFGVFIRGVVRLGARADRDASRVVISETAGGVIAELACGRAPAGQAIQLAEAAHAGAFDRDR